MVIKRALFLNCASSFDGVKRCFSKTFLMKQKGANSQPMSVKSGVHKVKNQCDMVLSLLVYDINF